MTDSIAINDENPKNTTSWQRIRFSMRERFDLGKRMLPPALIYASAWLAGNRLTGKATMLAEYDLNGDGKREAIVYYRGLLGYIDGNLNEQLRTHPEPQAVMCSGKNPVYSLPVWNFHPIGVQTLSENCSNQTSWGTNFFKVCNVRGQVPCKSDIELYLFYGNPSTWSEHPDLGRSYRVK